MANVTIESTRFGTIEVPDDIVLTFEQGMIGFPDLRRYAIIKQREDSVFMWLHSLDDGALAFPVVLPWVFYWDYEVDLSDADMSAIGVSVPTRSRSTASSTSAPTCATRRSTCSRRSS